MKYICDQIVDSNFKLCNNEAEYFIYYEINKRFDCLCKNHYLIEKGFMEHCNGLIHILTKEEYHRIQQTKILM